MAVIRWPMNVFLFYAYYMGELKNDIRERDAIDFASEDIGSLFRKMFFPTLMGMVSMVLLNLADGAFVGHGAGTEALAAINIAAPIFDLMIGLGIMFGIGCSVISSIHLSRGNIKAGFSGMLSQVALAIIALNNYFLHKSRKSQF